MRICFIADSNSIHTCRWIQPLIDANYEVYLVSYRQNNRTLPGVKEIIDLTQQINLRKIRFAVWGMWLHGYLKRIHPDILHAHQIPAAGWLGSLTGFHPFVVTGWGSDLLIEPHKSLFRKLLTKFVLSKTDYLTVPSKFMYNSARNLGFPEDCIYWIPWGIETNIFKPSIMTRRESRMQINLPETTPVILCPRGINPIYNLDIVIEACHSILPKFPDLKLILLKYNPRPEYLTRIKRQISTAKMESNVIWLPAQDSIEDMAYLYQISDVVLSIPSSEGYGFTPYEAMSSGIPSIISDLPVFEDDLQDKIQVLKVPVRDIHMTANALEMVLTSIKLRQTLIENGIRKCAGLNIQNRIDQVLSLYKYIHDAWVTDEQGHHAA